MSDDSVPPKPARPEPPSKTRKTITLILTAAVFVAAAWLMDAKWGRLAELPGSVADYVDLMVRGVLQNPTEEPTSDYWQAALDGMLDSLYMAWIGTMIGAVFSFPLGFLAAENVSPKPVVLVTRQVLNAIRAVPELILAIVVMMQIFGLGPLAGALALGVHSIGTLGKLTAEVIEGVDPGPIEAARAVGASRLEVLRWGVVPQALPETIAFWLYRFEINIRAGAVLGVVGAGGIGSVLSRSFQKREWDRIGVTLAVIIVLTIIIDNISAQVRRRVIAGREVIAAGAAA
jgi:phosphonate transport system permease protein